MNFNPAIVVVAYNRPKSLERLLTSISNAIYPNQAITLIISIDKSQNNSVLSVAENFVWNFGEKKVFHQVENLGLKKHVLKCGDLVNEYGSIIMLEDDLYVSPHFYTYASQALDFYAKDQKIAGISLYKHPYNVHAGQPFNVLYDNSDVFFLQMASSWGQAWTHLQWNTFKDWYDKDQSVSENDPLPRAMIMWPNSSWLKLFIKYMVENDLYFVYPRNSLATNFSEVGSNVVSSYFKYQVNLSLFKNCFRLISFNDSYAKYDCFFEISPYTISKYFDGVDPEDLCVDIYGMKDLKKVSKKYVLTRKKCKTYIRQFGLQLKPHELNILLNNSGKEIFYSKVDQVINSMVKDFQDFKYYFDDLTLKKMIKMYIKKNLYFLGLKRIGKKYD